MTTVRFLKKSIAPNFPASDCEQSARAECSFSRSAHFKISGHPHFRPYFSETELSLCSKHLQPALLSPTRYTPRTFTSPVNPPHSQPLELTTQTTYSSNSPT